jgi:hypothetical protein
LGERRPCKAEVVGSNPISSTRRETPVDAVGGNQRQEFFVETEASLRCKVDRGRAVKLGS